MQYNVEIISEQILTGATYTLVNELYVIFNQNNCVNVY